MKILPLKLILFLVFSYFGISSQNLVYKFKSRVVLQDWQLSSRAYLKEQMVKGAIIELYEGNKPMSKTTSDSEGNFELDLPSLGNFTILVSSPGYNQRKFSVTCNSTVIKDNETNVIPAVEMRGYVAPKLIKNVGILGLSNATIQMENSKNNNLVYNGLKFLVNLIDGEKREIQKFCTCNKLGDEAFQNKNYALAKRYYLMASNIMDIEEYPKERLARAEENLKQKSFDNIAKASTHKNKTVAIKSTEEKAAPMSTEYKSPQKSNSGGRKVLPILGGKK